MGLVAAMYGATKAFLSQFAACLHVEVKSRGELPLRMVVMVLM
jgi:short-subunit dehydrogenase